MSIKLDIQPYCESCDEFEPDVNKSYLYSPKTTRCETVIRCAHAKRCESIKEYLSKENKDG